MNSLSPIYLPALTVANLVSLKLLSQIREASPFWIKYNLSAVSSYDTTISSGVNFLSCTKEHNLYTLDLDNVLYINLDFISIAKYISIATYSFKYLGNLFIISSPNSFDSNSILNEYSKYLRTYNYNYLFNSFFLR